MKKPAVSDLPLDENPEWSAGDVEKSVSFAGLPAALRSTLSGRGRGQQKEPVKQLVSVRYSQEVINKFKATGTGWQTRMDKALLDWLAEHDPNEIRVKWLKQKRPNRAFFATGSEVSTKTGWVY